MRNITTTTIIGLLTVLMLAAGCSSGFKVKTETSPDADFGSFKTFRFRNQDPDAFKKHPVLRDPVFRKRLGDAIVAQMNLRGFKYIAEGDADLMISGYLNYEQEERKRFTQAPDASTPYLHYGGFWGGYYGYSQHWSHYSVETVTEGEGTLMLDVVDVKSKALVYRTIADGAVEDGVADKNENIEALITRMFKDMPDYTGKSL